MDILNWHTGLSTGDILLDEYRKKILDKINYILDQDSAVLEETFISDALSELTSISVKWLPLEEKRWEMLGCSNFHNHKKGHQQFVLMIAEFCELSMRKELDPIYMQKEIYSWLDKHIFCIDIRCSLCISEKSETCLIDK
jgi:hemerythrin